MGAKVAYCYRNDCLLVENYTLRHFNLSKLYAECHLTF
jgi:hypothetical protein